MNMFEKTNTSDYYCYLLVGNNKTYIGITNNLVERIKKHNTGKGAKATRMYKEWTYHTIIGIFTKIEALKFEWNWKHYKKNDKWTRTIGIQNRLKRLDDLMEKKLFYFII
jgi:putative endonuclease